MSSAPAVLRVLHVGSPPAEAWKRHFENLGWPWAASPWEEWTAHSAPPGPWDVALVDMTGDRTPEDWLQLHHLVARVAEPVVVVVAGPVPSSFHYPRAGGLRVGLVEYGASLDVIRSTVHLVRQIYHLVRRQPGDDQASVLSTEQRTMLLESVQRIRQDFLTVEALLDPSPVSERPLQPLRGREQEVFRLVMQGLSLKVIADRLSIAESTVKKHVHSIYQKRGVSSRAELMALD